jgi:hypothetical protein
VSTPGGSQLVTVVSEPGLYSLILRSSVPGAREFKRWVTHEVLPAIRRTGTYSTAGPAFAIPGTYADALRAAADAADRAELAQQRAAELEVPARAWNNLAAVNGDYSVSDVAKALIRDPQLKGKTGPLRLWAVMQHELKWVFRDSADGRPRAYQSAMERGLLTQRMSDSFHTRRSTGELVPNPPQVRITLKGITALYRRLGGAADVHQLLDDAGLTP